MIPIKALAIHLATCYVVSSLMVLTLLLPILVYNEKWSVNKQKVVVFLENIEVDDFNQMLRSKKHVKERQLYEDWTSYVS